MSDDPVHAQYEALPYPPRDPREEAKRLVTGSPSHLAEVDHYLFAGARDFARPFRVLVAGGGTGDATVMLAQQLSGRGAMPEIVHLDLSPAAIAVARARIAARRLSGVTFVEGSLLALEALGLGGFDYIDCCGVLHHLEDPGAGLASLARALAPDGGLGLMMYAPYGRTGVYPAQAMLRMIAATGETDERLALARRLLNALPEMNWLRRNPFVGDHRTLGDAGLFDLLLHARDRPFAVPELFDLLAGAGLRPVALVDPVRYDPAFYLADARLLERIAPLPWGERAAFAELLAGNIKSHVVYAVAAANGAETVAAPDGPDMMPVLREEDGPTLAREMPPGAALVAEYGGLSRGLPLPGRAAAILARIDGRRTLGDIQADIARTSPAAAEWGAFKREFDQLYAAFNGTGRMFLRRPPRG